MGKVKKLYFTMYDGEDLDNFFDFLDKNNIKYDCTGTGDIDFDGNAENDVVIFYEDEEISKKVYDYLCSL